MRLSALLKLVSSAPELEESLSVDQLHTLLDLVCLLKPTLSIIQPGCNPRSPPERLPINVHEFLRCCLGVDDETMKVAWRTLSRSAWGRDLGESFAAQLSGRYLQMFLDHGHSRGIGMIVFLFKDTRWLTIFLFHQHIIIFTLQLVSASILSAYILSVMVAIFWWNVTLSRRLLWKSQSSRGNSVLFLASQHRCTVVAATRAITTTTMSILLINLTKMLRGTPRRYAPTIRLLQVTFNLEPTLSSLCRCVSCSQL